MHISRLLVFIPLLFLAKNAFPQKLELKVIMMDKSRSEINDTIYYSWQHPLSWDDFKGTPDLKNPAGAVTASGYAYNAGIVRDNDEIFIKISIYTFFVKHESWKKSIINDPYHLIHEQHHFDISRLGAEDFYNKLTHTEITAANYKTLIGNLFDKSYNENIALQEKYDNETQHSIKTREQLAWNQLIEKEIKNIK